CGRAAGRRRPARSRARPPACDGTTRRTPRVTRRRAHASGARRARPVLAPTAPPRGAARAARAARARLRGLREAPGSAVLERAEDPARDDHLVHLLRAVVDARG